MLLESRSSDGQALHQALESPVLPTKKREKLALEEKSSEARVLGWDKAEPQSENQKTLE